MKAIRRRQVFAGLVAALVAVVVAACSSLGTGSSDIVRGRSVEPGGTYTLWICSPDYRAGRGDCRFIHNVPEDVFKSCWPYEEYPACRP